MSKYKRPEEITFISYIDGFADPWTILIEYDNGYTETVTSSNRPDWPLGVFNSTQGCLIDVEDAPEKDWADLPETLQKYMVFYVEESKKMMLESMR